MTFRFEIDERARTVEVSREAQGVKVVVDGRPRVVQAVRVSATSWSLLLRDPDGGNVTSVEAAVVPQNGNGGFDVYVDGHRIPVAHAGGFGRRARAAGGAQGSGPQRLVAPMPGKVVRVLVKPGDQVTARQGLVVVEAMKMENELRAAREGRVREVSVSEGQSVDAGAALVIVE